VINTIRCTAVRNHKLAIVDVYAGKQAHHNNQEQMFVKSLRSHRWGKGQKAANMTRKTV
jgi:hypothetical protein